MSQYLLCDFCEHRLEHKPENLPKGWARIKLDRRSSENVGGRLFKLDACPKCNDLIECINSRERAVEFIKKATIPGPDGNPPIASVGFDILDRTSPQNHDPYKSSTPDEEPR